MFPRISIVVPVHNVEARVRKCIDSLVDQTLKDIEIILVDDGSSDRSGDICDEYAASDLRIKSYHKKNGGASSARNFGLRLAQGEYIAFVDSDDYIESDMLSTMVDIAESKNIDIVNCCHWYENSNGVIEKKSSRWDKNKILYHEDIVSIINSSVWKLVDFYFAVRNIYKRKLLVDNNIFFDESVKYGEDTIFNLYSFFHAKSVYSVEKYFYHYVENSEGQIQAPYKTDYINHMTMTYEKILDFYKNIMIDEEKLYRIMNAKVIEGDLVELIANAWKSPEKYFRDELRLIRDCEMISKAFLNYMPRKKMGLFRKCVVYLMKYRLYGLTTFICSVRFMGLRKNNERDRSDGS